MVGRMKNLANKKWMDLTSLAIWLGIIILVNFTGSFIFDRFDLTEEQKLELVGAIITIADMVLDRQFGMIEYPHLEQNSVDEVPTSINGVGYEK